MEPVVNQPLVGQLKKSNVASFIKKKPVEVKSEQSEIEKKANPETQSNTKPATSSLLSMMSSYADSSDENSD